MTDAEDRVALFERLIVERGDPRGAYAAAIDHIRRSLTLSAVSRRNPMKPGGA